MPEKVHCFTDHYGCGECKITVNIPRKLIHSEPAAEKLMGPLCPKCGKVMKYFYTDDYHDEMMDTKASLQIEEAARQAQAEKEFQEVLGNTAYTPQYVPKCPTCGSPDITKISGVTKAAKVGAFGIFGAGDIGKTYKCRNCGSKW